MAADGGQAHIQRFMDQEHDSLLAVGDFDALFKSYLDHAQRWSLDPDPLLYVMLSQGLACAALFLSCRPRDEIAGFTLNIKEPAINVFMAGDASGGTVTGRVSTEDVQSSESNRLFVQSQRGQGGTEQTVLEVDGIDVPSIFEQYHARSRQFPARFFDYDDGRFAMALGLPGMDEAWLKGLERESFEQHLKADHQVLESRDFHFMCGCDTERMLAALRGMFGENPDQLFEGESFVEVQCPRCGREWQLDRSGF